MNNILKYKKEKKSIFSKKRKTKTIFLSFFSCFRQKNRNVSEKNQKKHQKQSFSVK